MTEEWNGEKGKEIREQRAKRIYGLPYILFCVTFLDESNLLLFYGIFAGNSKKERKKKEGDAIEGVLLDLRCV